MTPQNPRGPQPSPPGEPGWWQASDGLWYPPESAPAGMPTPPVGPEAQATPPTPPEPEPTMPAEPLGATPSEPAPPFGTTPTEATPEVPAPPFVPPVPPSGSAEASTAAAAPAKPTNGLAITSLLLGIFGFCLCAPGGIAAVITGFIARKKPTGKGMATTGIVLGFINIVASIVVVIATIVGGSWSFNWASDKAEKIGGVVSPSDYRIRDLACDIGTSSITATGMIENRTRSSKNFVVVVEFKNTNSGDVVEGNSFPVTSIPAGESKEFEATTSDLGSDVRRAVCTVKEVRNFLN